MCLAIPAEIVELLDSEQATVEIGGVQKIINISLIDDPIRLGDYVILHVGYAIARLDEAEARKTLALIADMRDSA